MCYVVHMVVGRRADGSDPLARVEARTVTCSGDGPVATGKGALGPR
jgi:hypothetical protein